MQRILSLAVVAHTTSHKRQSLRPRPVSLKVSWAKPGFGGTIALCVLNGTDLLCVGYGVETCSNHSSACGHVTARAAAGAKARVAHFSGANCSTEVLRGAEGDGIQQRICGISE